MEKLSSKWIKVSEPFPHVLHVELAREPVNAFCTEFWKAYGALFDKLIEEPHDIRALVLSSAIPKLFTAGIDRKSHPVVAGAITNALFRPIHALPLRTVADAAGIANASSDISATDAARTSFKLKELIFEFQSAITKPEKCPFPVIVAVHGTTFGLGVDIVAACDVRYAAENAVFSIKEVDIGLAADIGSLAFLTKATGNESLLRELAYTGRSFSAKEAEKLGLVSRVVPGGRDDVVKEALGLARVVAGKSPVAVTGTKGILNHSRDHSIRENLEYTALWNSAALMTRDIKDSLAAFQTKSPPKFSPLNPKAPSKL